MYGPQTEEEQATGHITEILLDPKTGNKKNLKEFSGHQISVVFFFIMKMDYEIRKQSARIFMENIAQNYNFQLWMKNNLHPDVVEFISQNCEIGFFDRILPNFVKTKFLGAGGQFGQVVNTIKSGVSAFSINLDLFFDCGFLVLLAYMHSAALEGGILTIIFWVMASLVFLPTFFNYCKLFARKTSKQMLLLFCGFPIFPIVTQSSTILLMHTKAIIQFDIDAMTMSTGPSSNMALANKMCRTADLLWKKLEKLEQVKSEITKQRLLETSAEGQPQSYIKLILLFLTLSATPLYTIPKTIFGKDLKFYGFPPAMVLTAFIVLPIVKNAYFYLKTIDKKRTTVGSILLILFIFFCLLGKFVGIVTVFSPPLGLFSIHGHWKAQQKPFSCALMDPPNGDGFYYGASEEEVKRTSWMDISGNTCKDGQTYRDIVTGLETNWDPQEVSIFMNLQETCLFVCAIALIRLLAIFVSKRLISTSFRESKCVDKISHMIYNSLGAVPLTHCTWEDATTFHEIGLKYQQENKEMMTLLAINLFENILLILPMAITFPSIVERHLTLQRSIGVTDLESRSLRNSVLLVVCSLVAVVGSYVLEIILWQAYYRHGHSQKILLNQARNLSKEKVFKITFTRGEKN